MRNYILAIIIFSSAFLFEGVAFGCGDADCYTDNLGTIHGCAPTESCQSDGIDTWCASDSSCTGGCRTTAADLGTMFLDDKTAQTSCAGTDKWTVFSRAMAGMLITIKNAGATDTIGMYTDPAFSGNYVKHYFCNRQGNDYVCNFPTSPAQRYYITTTSATAGKSIEFEIRGRTDGRECADVPVSDTASVGPCSMELYPVGYDHTDASNNGDSGGQFKTSWYVAGSQSRTSVFNDEREASCDMDMKFSNAWSINGDQITVTSNRLEYAAAHDVLGGYYLMARTAGCTMRCVAGSCNIAYMSPQSTGASAPENVGQRTAATAGFPTPILQIQQTYDVDWCGDSEATGSEVCDGGTQTCADDSTVSCRADCTGWNACPTTTTSTPTPGPTPIPQPVRCQTNADCTDDPVTTTVVESCCTKDPTGPATLTGTCVGKTIYSNPVYLCDPGVWFKCDESSLGSKQEFDGKSFECISENGSYMWLETTAKKQAAEGFAIDMPSIFMGIVSFFGILFFI